ncbi:MAG: glutathione peroxidase, partial [Cyclobacteriaceae bacterium]
MKNMYYLMMMALFACHSPNQKQEKGSTEAAGIGMVSEIEKNMVKDFYDFELNDIDGNPVNFSKFKGKKLLIVNVASKCGFTPQYAELQELYEKHKEEVTILAFPANNFGGQEPGTNEDIKTFCSE